MIILLCKKCHKPYLSIQAKTKEFTCENCGEIHLYEVDFMYIEDKIRTPKSMVCSISADGSTTCS